MIAKSGTDSSKPLCSSGKSRANLEDDVGIPVPHGNCLKPRDAFGPPIDPATRLPPQVPRRSITPVYHVDGRLHCRSLRRHFQTAAFLLEREIVPAALERLSDLDRPDDLARWPGPLE